MNDDDLYNQMQNDPELQKKYLAQLFYGENTNISEEEAMAIADSVYNRVGKPGFRGNVIDVIRQPKQFTPFSNPERVAAFNEASPAWQQYYAFAEKAYNRKPEERSPYTHYYAPDKVSPFWKDDMQNLTQVGRHMFGTENPEARRRSPAALARKRESRKKK